MAFCTKCGGRIDDNAQICPNCGQPINISSTRINTGGADNRGGLIVSAKAGGGRIAVIVICALVEIIAAFVFIAIGKLVGASWIGWLLLILALATVLFNALQMQSYIEVYENAVIGTTSVDSKPSRKYFRFSYEDIIAVEKKPVKLIVIYTKNEAYTCVVYNNRDFAFQEIQRRINQPVQNT